MKQPDIDPRYTSAEGCRELAREMDAQARSAKLLMLRHEGWARALRSRAENIDKAETLELEAKVKRALADQVANQPVKSSREFLDEMFGWMGR